MIIPLGRAVLCIDEDLIFDGTVTANCPQCGSRQTMPIARWLNRERKPRRPGKARRTRAYRSRVRG